MYYSEKIDTNLYVYLYKMKKTKIKIPAKTPKNYFKPDKKIYEISSETNLL